MSKGTKLQDQVAWISGAASGIGEGVARLFAREGAAVALVDVQAAKGAAIAAQICAEGGRAVYRLSGTGTEGATLRVYLERFEPDPGRHGVAPDAALAPAASLADLQVILGRSQPSVVA